MVGVGRGGGQGGGSIVFECLTINWKITGLVSFHHAVLFLYTRNFPPHCLSPPRCMNGCCQAGGNPGMA